MNNNINKYSISIIHLIIVLLVISIYYQVKKHEMIIFDDDIYFENKNVKNGITFEGIRWAFSFEKKRGTYWHPLTWLSIMLGYEIYGDNPGMHLVMNLFIHLINCTLLFILIHRLTGAVWKSAFVSFIFAAHPLNVESVAWFTQRPNLLSACFLMLTLLAYKLYTEKNGIIYYLLVLLIYILGLLAKPSIVTLPFILLLLDYWPLERLKIFHKNNLKILILEKIPFLILSGASVFITIKSIGHFVSNEYVSFIYRIQHATLGYIIYLFKLIWPYNLSIFYPRPMNIPIFVTLISAVVIVSITTIIFVLRKEKYLTVGWLWFLGTLIPVMGFVQAGLVGLIADRYAYVPFIGLYTMMIWGISKLLERYKVSKSYILPVFILFVLNLTVTSWVYLQNWKNSLTIFEHAIKVNPENALAHNNLGTVLAEEQRYEEAVAKFKMALKIHPNYKKANYNIGLALMNSGSHEESIKYLERYVELCPDDANAYGYIGKTFLKIKEVKKSIKYFTRALELDSRTEDAHFGLAMIYNHKGQINEAIKHYQSVIQYHPENIDAYIHLGNIYFRETRLKDAKKLYQKAIDLKPYNVDARLHLADVYLMEGKTEKAINIFEEVEKSIPYDIKLRYRLNRIRKKIERSDTYKD